MIVRKGKILIEKTDIINATATNFERYEVDVIEKNDNNYNEIVYKIVRHYGGSIIDGVENVMFGEGPGEWSIVPNATIESVVINKFNVSIFDYLENMEVI